MTAERGVLACPDCGGGIVETTLMGTSEPLTVHDPNRASCKLGHRWRISDGVRWEALEAVCDVSHCGAKATFVAVHSDGTRTARCDVHPSRARIAERDRVVEG